jgi:nucleoid DNA-binding protein
VRYKENITAKNVPKFVPRKAFKGTATWSLKGVLINAGPKPPCIFKRMQFLPFRWGEKMTKEELIEKVRTLLEMDDDLDFLLTLKQEELERLVAFIGDKIDQDESP